MEALTQNRSRLIPLEKIPSQILGAKLNEADKDNLSYGEHSRVLKNLHFQDGSVKDAKVRVTLDKTTDELKFHFDFVQEKLVIPNKILNYSLSEDDKRSLAAKRTIGPLSIENVKGDIYLKVDPELNKVVITTGRQIGIPKEIGEYKLSVQDKNILANGKTLPAHLFSSEKGYFVANFSMTHAKDGYEFSNVKSVSEKEAKILMGTLNSQKVFVSKSSDLVEGVVHEASRSIGNNEKNEFLIKENDNKAKGYIDTMNTQSLNGMVKDGYRASQDVIRYLKDHPVLKREDKIIVDTILNTNIDFSKDHKQEKSSDLTTKNDDTISKDSDKPKSQDKSSVDIMKDPAKEKKQKSNSGQKTKNLIDTAFCDV